MGVNTWWLLQFLFPWHACIPQSDKAVLRNEKNDLIRKRTEMCRREREEGERETEDGNNSLSLKTNKANLNLRLRTSSLVFDLVRPPRRPFPALPNQFNLSLLIPLPFSIRRSLQHTLTKADFSMMDGLCGKALSDLHAGRRAVHLGTRVTLRGGS